MCYPFLPTLSTDLFASRTAGTRVRCEDYAADSAPAACVDAHSTVVTWSAGASLISNCVVSLLLTPLLGGLSDLHGRKPFIVAGFAASLPFFLALIAAARGLAPAYLPYCFSALFDGVNSFSVSQAYIADVVAPERRAVAFGLVTAVVSVALLLGPALAGAVPDVESALWWALLGLGATTAWVALFLPESLSKDARQAEAQRRADAAAARSDDGVDDATRGGRHARRARLPGSLRSLRDALRAPLFRRLAALTALCAVCGDALADVTSQTLQMRAAFTPRDMAAYFMIYGACGIGVQAFLMRPLLALAGERGAVLFGMACFVITKSLFGLRTLTRGMAFAAAAVGTGAEVIFPAVSALTANGAAAHEQGATQGGLFAARSLAAGLAPLGWAALFRACTRADKSPDAPPPQAVFWLASALLAAGGIVAAALPSGRARSQEVAPPADADGDEDALHVPLLPPGDEGEPHQM